MGLPSNYIKRLEIQVKLMADEIGAAAPPSGSASMSTARCDNP
jgi:hypothetical protein